MVLGSWNPESTICPFRARKWPFQAPKTLHFKGTMANFEAKNTVKQEKWYPFHACTGGGGAGRASTGGVRGVQEGFGGGQEENPQEESTGRGGGVGGFKVSTRATFKKVVDKLHAKI